MLRAIFSTSGTKTLRYDGVESLAGIVPHALQRQEICTTHQGLQQLRIARRGLSARIPRTSTAAAGPADLWRSRRVSIERSDLIIAHGVDAVSLASQTQHQRAGGSASHLPLLQPIIRRRRVSEQHDHREPGSRRSKWHTCSIERHCSGEASRQVRSCQTFEPLQPAHQRFLPEDALSGTIEDCQGALPDHR